MRFASHIITSAIFIVSAIIFMNNVLIYRMKQRWAIWIAAFVFLCGTTAVFFSSLPSFWNTAAFLIMVLSFGCFYYDWKRVSVCIFVLVAALFIAETVSFYFIELINRSVSEIFAKETNLILCGVISKLSIPAVLYILVKILRMTFARKSISIRFLLGCLSVPALSIFIFYYIYLSSTNHSISLVYSLVVSIVVVIMNITILVVFVQLTEHHHLRMENLRYHEQLDAFNCNQMSQVSAITSIRQVRHDLNSILLSVKIGIEQGNIPETLAILVQHLAAVNPASLVSNTGIYAIDSVINHKSEIARQSGIRVHVKSGPLRKLSISWLDVCAILSAGLDNSIEACRQLDSDEERDIDISLHILNQMLRISISNPYTGDIRKDHSGAYLTSKPSTQDHGFGINGMIRLLEKNSGAWEFCDKDHIFILTIMLPESLVG